MNNNIPDLNPFNWESCKLSQRNEMLPRVGGIYAVISGDVIYYIGKSEDLRQRWFDKNHHRFEQAEALINPFVCWLKASDSDLDRFELALIEKYRDSHPLWNVAHGAHDAKDDRIRFLELELEQYRRVARVFASPEAWQDIGYFKKNDQGHSQYIASPRAFLLTRRPHLVFAALLISRPDYLQKFFDLAEDRLSQIQSTP